VRRAQGTAVVEYAAVVVVVATLIGALLVMRPHRVGRVPIDPVRAVGVLVQPPPVTRPRPVRAAPARPRPRPASPRPRPRRPVVQIPQWLTLR